MMNRKHFKAFAEAISQVTLDKDKKVLIQLISKVCANDNPNFDWDKFEEASLTLT